MDSLLLSHILSDGALCEATFCPQVGMNLLSLKFGEVEVIDQQTLPLFEERMAGLGALIGPHFHHRPNDRIPPFEDSKLFPHIVALKAQKKREFFSHGIGRYVPWRIISASSHFLQATLSGRDRFGSYQLKEIEGQDFEMHYRARLIEDGLEIFLKFKAEKEATMGLHTYYVLPPSGGIITSVVEDVVNKEGSFESLPQEWKHEGKLMLPADGIYDHGFLCQPRHGKVNYKNNFFSLNLSFSSSNECSWQLYRPEGSTFICIEPICARNPRALTQKEGELTVTIKKMPFSAQI